MKMQTTDAVLPVPRPLVAGLAAGVLLTVLAVPQAAWAQG